MPLTQFKKPPPKPKKSSLPDKKTDMLKPPQVQAENSAASRTNHVEDEVEHWLEIFGEEDNRQPTEKAPQIKPRNATTRRKKRQPEEAPATDRLKADEVKLSENSIDAWMGVFGETEKEREPTDPAPQRSDPKKQGRYKNQAGKREPTVHKRMATSDEIYLSEGEVDAWMDVFGIDEEEDS
jgi:hypothetical protein